MWRPGTAVPGMHVPLHLGFWMRFNANRASALLGICSVTGRSDFPYCTQPSQVASYAPRRKIADDFRMGLSVPSHLLDQLTLT